MKNPATLSFSEAHRVGGRPLSEIVDKVSPGNDLRRTFVLWRSRKLVPPRIRPVRGWLQGHRTALWPQELEVFLKDTLRFRGYAHLKGQRHYTSGQADARSHAALRLLLWAYGWDYPLLLVRRSLLHVLLQTSKLVPGRDRSPLDFIRWFFLSSHAIGNYRVAEKSRLGPKDQDRGRGFRSFASWGSVLTWAEYDLYRKLPQAPGLETMSFRKIVHGVRHADERSFVIARMQAGRILHSLFPQVQQSGGGDVRSPFSAAAVENSADDWIAWTALRPVLKELPKILRYLGVLVGWQIARLHEAA